MTTRREVMKGVAALAAATYGEPGESIHAHEYSVVGGVENVGISSSGTFQHIGWMIDTGEFDEDYLRVGHSTGDVFFEWGGSVDGQDVGGYVNLDPDDARELAAAIYQTAEEIDRLEAPDAE